jgi:P27 family predicted phage terminase small subunit
MGLRGPAPELPRVLELRGSNRAGRHKGAPQPPCERPPAPVYLSPVGKHAFRALAVELEAIQVIARVDQNALARYVVLWERWRKLEDFLKKNGDTYVLRGKPDGSVDAAGAPVPGPVVAVKTYPQAKQATALAGELLKLEREFGLTPAARARLSVLDELGAGAAAPPSDPGKLRYFAHG